MSVPYDHIVSIFTGLLSTEQQATFQNHLNWVSWTLWVHSTQVDSTLTGSQSKSAPLISCRIGYLYEKYADKDSAPTVCCYRVNMDQNLLKLKWTLTQHWVGVPNKLSSECMLFKPGQYDKNACKEHSCSYTNNQLKMYKSTKEDQTIYEMTVCLVHGQLLL